MTNNVLGDIGPFMAAMLPELYLLAAAMFLLLYGVYYSRTANASILTYTLAILVITVIMTGITDVGAALRGMILNYTGQGEGSAEMTVMNGMFVSNYFTVFSKQLILVAGAVVLLLSWNWLTENGGKPFEFVVLVLFSLLGMMLMVSANDLLTLYMALEMSSLALYVLASFSRDHAKSSEAGLKYFVLGSLASGMMLFGMSLVYGFAGTTGFDALAQIFGQPGPVSKGVIVGLVLVMVGFCFKLSAVPFHMWTPDVYEGAPTPVTAFFATAPKIAALMLFTRFLMQPFGELIDQWRQVVVFVSVASMVVGALGAIMQTNIKRLLAYSSIGHVGFMLMGLAAGNQAGAQSMMIYVAVYIFMSAGAFGCVLAMKRDNKPVEDIRALSGLSRTRPLMAITISIFMFSMAGIPPLAGFFGKMYVVLAAVKAGLFTLAVIGVVTSVVAGYYYIKIVKIMYFDEPERPFDSVLPLSLKAGVVICSVVTLLFCVSPAPVVAQAKAAAEALLH
jgi:NADH-quinone oxidoreductase subunit N